MENRARATWGDQVMLAACFAKWIIEPGKEARKGKQKKSGERGPEDGPDPWNAAPLAEAEKCMASLLKVLCMYSARTDSRPDAWATIKTARALFGTLLAEDNHAPTNDGFSMNSIGLGHYIADIYALPSRANTVAKEMNAILRFDTCGKSAAKGSNVRDSGVQLQYMSSKTCCLTNQ